MIFIAFVFFIFIIQYHANKVINHLLMIRLNNKVLLEGYEINQNRINTLKEMYHASEEQPGIVREQLELSGEHPISNNNESVKE